MVLHKEKGKSRCGWLPNSYLILKEEDDPLVDDIQTFLLGKREQRERGERERAERERAEVNYPFKTDERRLCDDDSLSDRFSESDSTPDLMRNGCCYYRYRVMLDSILCCVNGKSVPMERGITLTVVDKDSYGKIIVLGTDMN